MTEESKSVVKYGGSKKELEEMKRKIERLEAFIKALRNMGGSFPRLLDEHNL